jgi:predicted metal-binding membrane protein
MGGGGAPFPRLPARDRTVVLLSLAGLTGLAWAYLALLASGMDAPAMGEAMLAPQLQAWSWPHFSMMAAMWAVMMVGMMVPSATPMILLYARVNFRSGGGASGYGRVAAFVSGYVLLWGGFSVAAALAQVGLEQLALLDAATQRAGPVAGALLLLGAGVYQLTPLKQACLEHCRSPLGFIMHRWRRGSAGALRMGLEHGLFCVGCCWVLMLLLFAAGVMNLVWVAAIAALVLVEKLAPAGPLLGRMTGIGLMAAGAAMMVASV